MAFCNRKDIERVIGNFQLSENGNWFDIVPKDHETPWLPADFDKQIVVSANPINDSGKRYVKILKRVAFVVVDEAADGSPVIERWPIRKLKWFNKA